MGTSFWEHLHGGSTHFPIVLLLTSVVLDAFAGRMQDKAACRGLRLAALGTAAVATLGATAAAATGLVLTRGRMVGGGGEKMHHLFAWPALALSVGLVAVRLFWRGRRLPPPRFYVGGMGLAAVLMLGAGYTGGNLLLGAGEPDAAPATPAIKPSPAAVTVVKRGRELFLKNCAHCHGADARGDEGPDLHGLDLTDAQVTSRIRNGKKGQMTAFANKLPAEDIACIATYLHTLRPAQSADSP